MLVLSVIVALQKEVRLADLHQVSQIAGIFFFNRIIHYDPEY